MLDASEPSREIQDALAERFLRYSRIATLSDAAASIVPSSAGQWELAELLREELHAAGAADVHLSDTCVVTAHIPSTRGAREAGAPPVGLCTHLDTADVNLSPQVRARVHSYEGGDIQLNRELGLWLCVADHPQLERYAGDRILVTDGTSVLGADDKAGVASVMECAVRMLQDPSFEHGDVYLAFVPDEEIGLRGVRTIDLDRFPVQMAFTLDSCELGEVVEETFNAAHARICISGVSAHPMNAKGVMVNPILVAHDLVARLDRSETPEHTEGREGYIWVNGLDGTQSNATITIAIRDHDRVGFEEKKERLRSIVSDVQSAHPRARLTLEIDDVYANIRDSKTEENARATGVILRAMENLGIEPKPLAMRGGTDGSWLSQQGIFTPNFFTGAHNFHSACEFLPLSAFEKSYKMVGEVLRLLAEPTELAERAGQPGRR